MAGLGGIGLSGCTEYAPPTDDSAGEARTGTKREAFSPAGVERLIPLRVVQFVQSCAGGSNPSACDAGDTTPADLEVLRLNLDHANAIYQPAGVQLWIRAFEKYEMADFWKMPDVMANLPWATVRPQLQQLFSATLDPTAWASKRHTDAEWLTMTNDVWGDPNEILVVIPESASTSYARFPHQGRDIVLNATHGAFLAGWNMAHELGHNLGLQHPFGHGVLPDPRTGLPMEMSARWDLVYLPCQDPPTSRPHDYFANEAEAAAAAATGTPRTINQTPGGVDNCHMIGDVIECDAAQHQGLQHGRRPTHGRPGRHPGGRAGSRGCGPTARPVRRRLQDRSGLPPPPRRENASRRPSSFA